MKPNSSLPRPNPGRRMTEKHRRQQMRVLYRQLASVVSRNKSLEKSPALDVLDHATNYIKQLEKKVTEMKARKDSLQLPVVIAVNESEDDETLEINIVCGSEDKNLKMDKVFRILEEEGAEVVSATYSTVDLKNYHTLLCKAFSPRLGMNTIGARDRLKSYIVPST